MRGHLLLLKALFVIQISSVALAWQEGSPAASTQNPHGPMTLACQKCHTASGWKSIRNVPEFDHNKTGYPLRGMHTKVRCEECHTTPLFRNVGQRCQDCHADIHRRKNGAECELCHRVNGWEVSIHSINEHQDRFPLVGAHAAVDCYACHKVGSVGQFNRQGLSTDCDSCHLAAFLKATSPNHQALGFSRDCQECHMSMDSWIVRTVMRAKGRR